MKRNMALPFLFWVFLGNIVVSLALMGLGGLLVGSPEISLIGGVLFYASPFSGLALLVYTIKSDIDKPLKTYLKLTGISPLCMILVGISVVWAFMHGDSMDALGPVVFVSSPFALIGIILFIIGVVGSFINGWEEY